MSKVSLRRMSESVRWAFDWKAWNPSETEFSHAISCVQLEEKDRLGKFVFRKDVRASLAGRLLMRKFVNEYAGIPYENVVFSRDERNKPILKTPLKNLSFNVSHQGNYTVLAGETRDAMLGVDVMKCEYTGGKELSEFFRLMNRNFSASEWDEIRSPVEEKEQIAMFCRHWALKECYVKAIGVGIVVDLKTIDFQTYSKLFEQSITNDTILRINGAKQNWLFEESLLDPDHCVAVALQENGEAPPPRNHLFEIIDSRKLLLNAVPLFPRDSSFAEKYFSKTEQPECWN